MELSALRIFKAVTEEGSVTLAAARLNRVQSNVSARLTQLEESLGVPLFEEELVLITNYVHPPVASPHDLARRTLLVFRSGCTYRRRLEAWFAEADVAATRISEFGTFEAIIGCVGAGMGVALMPKEIINQRKLAESIRVHALPPA